MTVKKYGVLLAAILCCMALFSGVKCDREFCDEDENTCENDSSTAQKSCKSSENMKFVGTVVEDSLGSTAGNPIPLVEITADSGSMNVTTSDAKGNFEQEVSCDATTYKFTASKYGYKKKTIEAVANAPTVDVKFTLTRDDSYDFQTITVTDLSSDEPLEDVTISVSGQGATAQFITGSTGTLSFPFPAADSGATRLVIQKSGYKTSIGDFNPITRLWTQVSGGGIGSATAGGLTIKLTRQQ